VNKDDIRLLGVEKAVNEAKNAVSESEDTDFGDDDDARMESERMGEEQQFLTGSPAEDAEIFEEIKKLIRKEKSREEVITIMTVESDKYVRVVSDTGGTHWEMNENHKDIPAVKVDRLFTIVDKIKNLIDEETPRCHIIDLITENQQFLPIQLKISIPRNTAKELIAIARTELESNHHDFAPRNLWSMTPMRNIMMCTDEKIHKTENSGAVLRRGALIFKTPLDTLVEGLEVPPDIDERIEAVGVERSRDTDEELEQINLDLVEPMRKLADGIFKLHHKKTFRKRELEKDYELLKQRRNIKVSNWLDDRITECIDKVCEGKKFVYDPDNVSESGSWS